MKDIEKFTVHKADGGNKEHMEYRDYLPFEYSEYAVNAFYEIDEVSEPVSQTQIPFGEGV